MTLGSLFDGIGGFPLAAIRHGITPVWASEIDSSCISITKRHFPNMKHLGDITEINGADIDPVDIITFGSPCQDLSVAGKRKGLVGERSGLFSEAIRIIKEMRGKTNGGYPTFTVWENVPGAFSSNDGEDFRIVLQEIISIAEPGISIPRPPVKEGKAVWESAGAIMGDRYSLAYRTLDAQYWGVPQRRRRIFLIADFGSRCAGEILFKSESLSRDSPESGSEGKRTPGDIERNIRTAGFNGWRSESGSIEYTEDKSPCIQATKPPDVIVNEVKASGFLGNQGSKANGIGYAEEFSPTLKSEGGGNSIPDVLVPVCIARRRLVQDIGEDLSPAIMANDHKEPNAVLVMNDQGGNNINVEKDDVSPCLRGETHGNLPVVLGQYAVDFGRTADRIQMNAEKAIERSDDAGADGKGIKEEVAYALNTKDRHAVMSCDFRNFTSSQELSGTLQAKPNGGQSLNCINPICLATGQANAEVLENLSPYLNCNHEQPIIGNGYAVRRLTPTECERLQGFPDGWTAYGFNDSKKFLDSLRSMKKQKGVEKIVIQKISDSARYKALGNSVAIPCVYFILLRIKESMAQGGRK